MRVEELLTPDFQSNHQGVDTLRALQEDLVKYLSWVQDLRDELLKETARDGCLA